MLRTLLLFISSVMIAQTYTIQKYPLLMPNVQPNEDELYLCTPVRVNYTKNFYIVGFEPKASMNVAHHILLYGCLLPGSSEDVWNCGEMVRDVEEEQHNPCKTGSQIIYAWARDAPKLTLPEDVGFKVGGSSSIQYLVLQVHYAHNLDGASDNSGVHLYYTEKPMPKLAGVLLLGTSGYIRGMSEEHMETACTIDEDKVLHPFAFRTHTHQLGRVVAGYSVRRINGKDNWTLLGKRNPQDPQMFYPVVNNVNVTLGDQLAARCTMESHRPYTTYIGGTNKDEMCNFYLMYWVENSEPLTKKYCFTNGPPMYYWDGLGGLNNIPDSASNLI
ncbi:hypothetical protein O3M35_003208 [Rhynocoris fuscipes]|uniref:peptidylglycine monooxygenase n=2 Tax=Rhynocoris fuscipes TaxID=488301 RepID=A0AAW1CM79_9HEMI